MIKTFTLFGITDVGRQRSHNEDNFVVARDVAANAWGFRRSDVVPAGEAGALLVVADGMGGTNAGEVASHLAQEYVQEAFQQLTDVPKSAAKRESFLRDCIVRAHERIVEHQHAHLDTAGMGTTLVIAWVIGNQLHTAWSGDSRCYVYTPGEPLVPFTDDHSMVWDLVKKGSLTAEEARTHPESNLILQSLGSPEQPPKPSSRSTTLYTGDRVLVCSDGLNGMLPDQRIEQLLSENKGTADTCADLVEHANRAGGEDNITCLLLDVVEAEDRPGTTTGIAGVSANTGKRQATTAKNPGLPHLAGRSGREHEDSHAGFDSSTTRGFGGTSAQGSYDPSTQGFSGTSSPNTASDRYGIDDGYASEVEPSSRSGGKLWLLIALLFIVGSAVAYFMFFQNNEDDVTTDPTEDVGGIGAGNDPETPMESGDDAGGVTDPDAGAGSTPGTTDDQGGSGNGTATGTGGSTSPEAAGSTGDGGSSQGSGNQTRPGDDNAASQPGASETAPESEETPSQPTPSEPSFRVPTDDQAGSNSKPDSGTSEPDKNPAPDTTEQAATGSIPSGRLPAIMNPAGTDTTTTSPEDSTADENKPSESTENTPEPVAADSTSQPAVNPEPKPQF